MKYQPTWKTYLSIGWAFVWRLYMYAILASLLAFLIVGIPVLLGLFQPSEPSLISIALLTFLEIPLLIFVLVMAGKGAVNAKFVHFSLTIAAVENVSE